MSMLIACDAPECDQVVRLPAPSEVRRLGAAAPPWLRVEVEREDDLFPLRVIHACSPEHAVSALADALGLELDPGKVRP